MQCVRREAAFTWRNEKMKKKMGRIEWNVAFFVWNGNDVSQMHTRTFFPFPFFYFFGSIRRKRKDTYGRIAYNIESNGTHSKWYEQWQMKITTHFALFLFISCIMHAKNRAEKGLFSSRQCWEKNCDDCVGRLFMVKLITWLPRRGTLGCIHPAFDIW